MPTRMKPYDWNVVIDVVVRTRVWTGFEHVTDGSTRAERRDELRKRPHAATLSRAVERCGKRVAYDRHAPLGQLELIGERSLATHDTNRPLGREPCLDAGCQQVERSRLGDLSGPGAPSPWPTTRLAGAAARLWRPAYPMWPGERLVCRVPPERSRGRQQMAPRIAQTGHDRRSTT